MLPRVMRPAWLALSLVTALVLSGCATPPAPEAAAPGETPVNAGSAASSATSSKPAVPPPPAPLLFPDIPSVVLPPFDTPDAALLDGEPMRVLESGGASWYGPGFHGRRTASGERFDMHGFTAAHKTLPFGTLVRVRSLVTGAEVDVRITDRGPFTPGRVIDVSRGAAQALGLLDFGVKAVTLLVPQSTPEVLLTPPATAKPARKPRPARRAAAPRVR